MKKSRLIAFLLAATGITLAAPPVQAQRGVKSVVPDLNAEGKPGEMARAQFKKTLEKFDRVDENRNGSIEKAEADKGMGEYEKATFDEKDLNKDGRLSWEEYLGHDKWKKDALK
jgi:EF hand